MFLSAAVTRLKNNNNNLPFKTGKNRLRAVLQCVKICFNTPYALMLLHVETHHLDY